MNLALDEFARMSPEEQEQHDSAEGLIKILRNLSGNSSKQISGDDNEDSEREVFVQQQRTIQQQQQAQQQVQPQQVQNRQRAKRNTQGFNANALTPQGKLKQSWINSLSNVDYSNNADRITAWYARGLVDRNA